MPGPGGSALGGVCLVRGGVPGPGGGGVPGPGGVCLVWGVCSRGGNPSMH